MSRPESEIERKLRAIRAPDESGAEERAGALVRRAAAGLHEPASRRRLPAPRRTLAALASVAVLAALSLSPAGAAVGELIGDAFDGEPEYEALTALPGSGTLLVHADSGLWAVRSDGSRRRLGDYTDGAWSPHGLYVLATAANRLTALTAAGDIHWTLSRPDEVTMPAWSRGLGYRVAYLSGGQIRIAAGDGSDDHRLAAAAAVRPAWRQPPPRDPGREEVSFVPRRARGSVRSVDVASSKLTAIAEPRIGPIHSLAWSDRDRLLAIGSRGWALLDHAGRILDRIRPAASSIVDGAISPNGGRVAILAQGYGASGARSELTLYRTVGKQLHSRTVFSAPGVLSGVRFSPRGEWLLLSWPETDQWVFINLATHRKLIRRARSIGDIAAQFAPGKSDALEAPTLGGWCCQASGR